MLKIQTYADQPDTRIVLQLSFAIIDDDGETPTTAPSEAYLLLDDRANIRARLLPDAGSSDPSILQFTIYNQMAKTLKGGRWNVVVVYDNVITRYADEDAIYVVEGDA